MWGSRFCLKLLLEGSSKNWVIHININEVTKQDFIPFEAGLSNMVKNGEIPILQSRERLNCCFTYLALRY
jgi:hypothetical protein